VVDRVYLKDLNRKATNDDYDYWLNKLNAKTLDQKLSCQWSGFSDSLIHNEVVLSVEYANWQKLNNHRASIRKVYTEILGRNSTNEEVANWEKEPDIERIKTFLKNTDEYKKRNDWLGFYINKYGWWIIGITAYLIYVLYQYIREHRRTKHS
jgi:hypothetical protein